MSTGPESAARYTWHLSAPGVLGCWALVRSAERYRAHLSGCVEESGAGGRAHLSVRNQQGCCCCRCCCCRRRRRRRCCFLVAKRPSNMRYVSQGRVCSDNCTGCHTETEVADQTCCCRRRPRRRRCRFLVAKPPSNMQCISQGRICSDNCTGCHTETETADQTCHLTQSRRTNTGPTGPSPDPMTAGPWQAGHWSTNFKSLVCPTWKTSQGAKRCSIRGQSLSMQTPSICPI